MSCQCVECVGYQKEPTDAEIITALETENAELRAKVSFMQDQNPPITGWPWDSPYMDGVEAGKAELEEQLKSVEVDLAIANLVRLKLTSGNAIPVERCTIKASEVEELSKIKEQP